MHRGAEPSFDISADLIELATTPVTVVAAGAKAILDLPKTLEVLETHGVHVIAYGQDDFPAFWSRGSGLGAPLRMGSAEDIARAAETRAAMGLSGGQLVANPIPQEYEIAQEVIGPIIEAALDEAGHKYEVVTVPGALEIPGAIALAAETGRYDGFVAIGVVIRGETYHFEVVSNESARGLMALSMDGIAIGNGILTVENEEQALVRARPDQKDKGGEAAKAAIAMLTLRDRFGA